MVFSSLSFLCVFLPIVFLLTLAVPGMRAKNLLLAVFSLVFYAYGEPVYVLLMVVSTIANWLFGWGIGRLRAGAGSAASANAENGASSPSVAAPAPGAAKALVAAAVVVNLAFLGFFKYAGLAVGTVNTLAGTALAEPDVALPIGISFYTFQAMSYVIDVYRGETPGQRSYLKVLLYISFFPQLISGPIVKYHDIAAQLDERRITLAGTALGFRRFCFGLAKKVLVANAMGEVADAVFSAGSAEVNIAVAWLGAIAYLLQIYFDFSGYSDMAIGLARMFGFTYKENFRYPYAATSIKEFWRRWHISLSTWLKEYLYIPLGGNRKGRPRTVANKVVVFFLCGLWHGAAWTFAVWGLIHGFFLLLEEYLPISKLPKPLGWLYTMLVVTFAFVLFRADSFGQGLFMWQQMLVGLHFEAACTALALQQLTPLFIVTLVVACVAASPIKLALQKRIEGSAHAQLLEGLAYALGLVLLVLSLLALASGGYNPFIYFRF